MKDQSTPSKPIIFKKSPMADRIRAYDWAATSLGPLQAWPACLRMVVNQMLDSAFPMLLWWGADNIQLYNDACSKAQRAHPSFATFDALGKPGKQVWPELWPLIKAKKQLVFETGDPVLIENKLIPTYYNPPQEDVYWTYTFDPIRDDEGNFAGLMAIFKEATYLHRQLQLKEDEQAFLLQLSDMLHKADSPEQIEAEATMMLGELLGADRVGFAEADDENQMVTITHNYIKPGVKPIQGIYSYSQYGHPNFELLKAGQMVVDTDTSTDELLTAEQKTFYQQLCIGASVNLPLLKAGKLCAVLFIHSCNAYSWSASQLSILKQSANRIWDAIQISRSERDLKLSENRYRTIFNAIDDAFMVIEFVFDENGHPVNYKFLVTNPAFEKQTGLSNVEGKTIKEIMPNVEPAWIERYGQVVLTGQPLRFEEYNEGTGGWYDVYAVAASHPGNQVVMVFHDITERKHEAQRKNDFLSMASHELKTPLTSVNGYLHMMKARAAEADDQRATDLCERITRQISKMTTIINSFLNIARLDEGKIAVESKQFDLVEAMREAEAEATSSFNTHQFIFTPTYPAFVNADREKIGLVIENLISNAAKYSAPGTKIALACVNNNGRVKVSVTDEGLGLSETDCSKVFKRFYRVENESTNFIAGFGIGLYICKEVIERHGGQIGVDSQLGKGSTFWFDLPVN